MNDLRSDRLSAQDGGTRCVAGHCWGRSLPRRRLSSARARLRPRPLRPWTSTTCCSGSRAPTPRRSRHWPPRQPPRARRFTAAGCNDLGNSLPGLLAAAEATRESAAGRARQQANAVLARAYVLASELAAKQHSDAAWVAADRALAAARASGMPIPVGEAARVLAITMRRSGNCSSAVRFLATEAAALDPAQERTGAVRTTLLLTAGVAADAVSHTGRVALRRGDGSSRPLIRVGHCVSFG
ncbi:hypothetical protein ACFWC9_26255 [Streptomyces goshikiensis]|uniref:hypothetical protein n=1 Tax=Streptomyces goshikiensis TaxID=1942 RepID=UPI0036BA818D